MAEHGTRRLVLQMGVSLDGMVAIPRGDGSVPVMESEWDLPPEDPELTELKLECVRDAGAHLMGRVTYEAMAGFWPTSSHAYAAPMNEIPKIVFSNTLQRGDWGDTQIIRGNLAEEIATLKREPGKHLLVHGGAMFVQSLARDGLIDEYRLVTHPLAVGGGLPMFKDMQTPLRMELVDARTFNSATFRVYRPC
jgi:dihydrofolate reductase